MSFKPWIPRVAARIEPGEQSRSFVGVASFLGPAYARFILRLSRIGVEGRERLVEEYRRSAADIGRFVIAYRHPGDSDPHLVYHVLTNLLAGEASATGPDGRPGAWYPSGTEVQLWASPLVLWALRNAGIVPVRHGGVDRAVLDYLVRAVAQRRRPMAIAPEGMCTFHRDELSELDPGTARIALLASERLAASGSPLPVRILPVAIHYTFSRTTSAAKLGRFVSRLERRLGLDGSVTRDRRSRRRRADDPASIRDRLLKVWEALVSVAESSYSRSWGIKPAPAGSGLRDRLVAVVEASIGRLEAYYGVAPASSLKARILNIRAEALGRVFYTEEELAAFSPVGLGAARRGAAEAFVLDQVYLAAAVAQFLDPSYIEGEPRFDRLVETAQNLHDLANRLEGLGMRHRSRYFLKDAFLVVGEPIEASRREGESRREAADRVQGELSEGFRKLIKS
ncbi:MAG: hypothetical protein Q8M76_01660 [Spirochaetaceae bacterium]|nr:hypothetical protein [Spirochaetaceae bacterium]